MSPSMLRLSVPHLPEEAIERTVAVLRSGQLVHGAEGEAFEAELARRLGARHDVVVSSGTARALLLGDVVHCPVELLDEEWAGMGDVDPELAKRTRNAMARELEGTDVPVAAAHFPGLQFGKLLVANGKRQWVIE